MADGDFVRPGDCLHKKCQILKGKVMAGVEAKAKFARGLRGFQISGYCGLRPGFVFFGISRGVEFNPVGPAGLCAFSHFGNRVDEDAYAYPFFLETGYHIGQEVLVPYGVPAGVGGDGVVGVRYQGYLVWNHFQDKVRERGDRVALDVEFGGDEGADFPYIGISDVPFVGPRVNGYALGAEAFAAYGGLCNVGDVPATGVAYSGDFIDIYA